jgi:hypothetical protein
MTNKYLEKIASIEKRAFDGDYDSNGEYGVVANRSISNIMVHDMLMKAIKDPNVQVMVDGDYDSVDHWKDPKKFHEFMADLKTQLPNRTKEEHDKHDTMQWDRNYTWSMGMKKDNPVVMKLIGTETTDRWGDPIEDPQSAILEYLRSKHKY